MITTIIFWLGLAMMVHTYILYPLLMAILAQGKTSNSDIYTNQESLPYVSILMAAYNEEKVLSAKIESLIAQDYLEDKIQIYIGSDNSTDETNTILTKYANKYDFIRPTLFEKRQGKPSIINQLAAQATHIEPAGRGHIFLCTDASVMLYEDTLFHLSKHFKNEDIGLVDARMQYIGSVQEGIAESESMYLSSEVRLKDHETKVWGSMMGPFGGCFAVRSDLYDNVPANFLVDDFYISMNVLDQGYRVINELEALCDEPVSHKISEEFRRKKRISAGNFQNLFCFSRFLNPFSKMGFAFISHKVLRWLGPFVLVAMILGSIYQAYNNSAFFSLVTWGMLIWFILIPLMDRLASFFGINISVIRTIRYFNSMQVALFLGFVHFCSGIKKGIWQPTSRE